MPNDLYQAIGWRIRRARESLGMSQQELARKVGFASPATISHFEAGERKISIADLHRIAQTLGVPVEHFLQDEPDSEEVHYLRLRAREIQPAAREAVVAFLSFARKHGNDAPKLPAGYDRLTPGRAATQILETAGLQQPPVSPRDIASRFDIPVFEWDFPDEISGIVVSEHGKVCIGINGAHPRARQRFTLAHELGHLMFDRNRELLFDFAGVEPIPLSGNSQHMELETKANQFAADLLMPSRWLRKDVQKYGLDITLLAKRYEVSQQALWFRLMSLHLIENNA